ncbi:MAG TPA: lytic transglycosylase domain-containing protein [Mycobacteriales bacterium]|nr:lytic transglycosylase domain-containing protein [Mycobacteriales bacterium]
MTARAALALALAVTVTLVVGGCRGTSQEQQPAAAPRPSTSTAAPTTSAPTAAPAEDPPVDVEALPPPAAATDPAALAAQVVQAETVLRSGTADPVATARAGMQQQLAYRTLASHPEWQEQVFAAVPPGLREAVVSQTDAAAGLFRLARPQPRLPQWRIVRPPPADELLGHYRAAAREFGVGWEYLAAIHLVETRMGRIRGTSSAGAQGPMQFLPSTWEAYGEGDIESPRDAIRAAARYLRAHGAPADVDRALYAYNHSDAYVRAISTYAAQMRADARLYRGYHAWQVYYRHVDGDRLLPVGWDGTAQPG